MNRVEPETSVRSKVRFLTISRLGYIPVQDVIYVATKQYKLSIKELI